MNKLVLGLIAASWATPILASPTLSECGWQASAQYLVEPWSENTATFSNGATRIAMIETVEPAAGSYGLLILSPPLNDFGERQCRVIHGFANLSLEGMTSAYDPAIGLQISVTAQVFLESEGEFASAKVDIVINQSSGEISYDVSPYFN
ncbi:MAG: hypothetical protein P8L68_09235 [Paracoccaceae bacterium]|nr:hypothetical protein [Paracoccaceae bacterium]MDG2258661.1 hypothetical protein [Paracoccaceae bacterium]